MSQTIVEACDLRVGDPILFHSNPQSPEHPVAGWVAATPGLHAITVAIITADQGLIIRESVRHINDDFWQKSEMAPNWYRWGAFEVHPDLLERRELAHTLREIMTRLKIDVSKLPPKEDKRSKKLEEAAA